MAQVLNGRKVGKVLIEEGLCPPNARNVELRIPADGAVSLHYDVVVSPEDIEKLHRALTKLLTPDTLLHAH